MARSGVISEQKPTRAEKSAPRSEPNLEIPATLLDAETVRRLIDAWIIPALVEEFLRCHNELPTWDSWKTDKGDQP